MEKTNIAKPISYLLIVLVAILSLALGIWLNQKLASNKADSILDGLETTVLRNVRPLKPFKLVDHNNQVFDEKSLRGNWNFLFFGFTHCPDVCPTTLKIMQDARSKLSALSQDDSLPHVYFVSVDPDRDSPEMLKKYVTYFDPSFIGITGSLNEIDKFTRQLGILYAYTDKQGSEDTDYIVNHSAQILVIDPQARLRAVISPPHDATTIAKDFKVISKYYRE